VTITAERPALASLTDDELAGAYCAAEDDALKAECLAEAERRDRAERAGNAARAAARQRNAEWEAAAYAQYLEAERACAGWLLSEAGQRTGRDAWPMLWQGNEQDARKLASEELLRHWDYDSPRTLPPAEYAAAKRSAAAEHQARELDALEAATEIPVVPVAPRPALRPGPDRPTVAPMQRGSIVRLAAALDYMARQTETVTARLVASNARLARSQS
jgi:hypothetical protein